MIVWFILQLEKVLQQGDIGDCAEPYMKEDKVNAHSLGETQIIIQQGEDHVT